MESLPMEMVLQITVHLGVRDIAACCGVSPTWREIFGSDEVWMPLCNVEAEEYLKNTPCRVEPGFSVPEVPGSNLPPMGRWRKAFLREVHVWANWKNKNYIVVNTGANRIVTKLILFLNNDFVIVFYDDWMELRNTRGARSMCVAQMKMWSDNIKFDAVVARNNMVVIFNCKSYVQVVQVDVGSCTMNVKHAFFVDGNVRPQYRDCLWSPSRQCAIVKNIFLGWTSMKSNTLHIWNFENETKLKVDTSPIECSRFEEIFYTRHCQDVIITAFDLRERDKSIDLRDKSIDLVQHEPFNLFVYSLESMSFLSFNVTSSALISESAIIRSHHLAVCFDSCMKVYNYLTSTCLFTVPIRKYYLCDPTRVLVAHNDKILFYHAKVLESFSPSTGRRTLCNGISQFYCCNEELVGVSTTRGKQEVWNFGHLNYSKTIETVWDLSKTQTNIARTKLMVPHEGGILIYVFW